MLDVGRRKIPDEKKKTKFVNVPVDEQTLADFAIACALRGVTMAGLLRPLIMETIREEKTREPEAFTREAVSMPAKVLDEPEHLIRKRRRA